MWKLFLLIPNLLLAESLSSQFVVERIISNSIEKKEIEHEIQVSVAPLLKHQANYYTAIQFNSYFEVDQTESLNGSFKNDEDKSTVHSVHLYRKNQLGTNLQMGLSNFRQKSVLSSFNSSTRSENLSLNTFNMKVEQSLWNNSFGYVDRKTSKILAMNKDLALIHGTQKLENLAFSGVEIFWKSYIAKQELETSIESRNVIDQLVKTVKRKKKVGYSQPGELSKVLAEYEMQDQAVKLSSAKYLASLQTLYSRLNMEVPAEVKFEASLEIPQIPPKIPFDQLKKRELRYMDISIDRANLDVSLTQNASRPDLKLVFEMESAASDEDSGSSFSEMTSFKKPRYYLGLNFAFYLDSDSENGELLEKRVMLNSQKLQREKVKRDLSTELDNAYRGLEANYLVALSRTKSAKLREDALLDIKKAYKQGRVDIDALIQAYRDLYNSKYMRLEAIGNYRILINQYANLQDLLIADNKIIF